MKQTPFTSLSASTALFALIASVTFGCSGSEPEEKKTTPQEDAADTDETGTLETTTASLPTKQTTQPVPRGSVGAPITGGGQALPQVAPKIALGLTDNCTDPDLALVPDVVSLTMCNGTLKQGLAASNVAPGLDAANVKQGVVYKNVTGTYKPQPVEVTDVTPSIAEENTETTFTLAGDRFNSVTSVEFDGTPCSAFSIVSAQELTCTVTTPVSKAGQTLSFVVTGEADIEVELANAVIILDTTFSFTGEEFSGLAENTAVSTWTNQHGATYNATSPASTNEPVVHRDVGTGKTSLYFNNDGDGVYDFMEIAGSGAYQPSSLSGIAVVKKAVNSSFMTLLSRSFLENWGSPYGSVQWVMQHSSSSKKARFNYVRDGSAVNSNTTAAELSVDTVEVLGFSVNSTENIILLNDVAQSYPGDLTNSVDWGAAASNTEWLLGRKHPDETLHSLRGNIYYIQIFDHALNQEQLKQIAKQHCVDYTLAWCP